MDTNLEIQTRSARIEPASINAAERSVEVVFSTGAEGLQRNFFGETYLESLSLEPKAVRLQRLNNGAPLLKDHDQRSIDSVIGVIENARVDGKTGTARVRFWDGADVEPIFKKVQDGILKNISVGYRVYEYERTRQEGGPDKLRAVDWEPMEISLVPMGLDDGAKVRGAQEKHPVRITNPQEEPASMETHIKAPQKQEAGTPAGEPVGAPAPIPIVDPAAVERRYKEGLAAGKTRVLEIQAQCRMAGLEEKDAIEICGTCETVDSANAEIVKRYAAKHAATAHAISSHIEVANSRNDKGYVEAIGNALLHRTNPGRFKLSDEGRQFRGMSLMDILKSNLDRNGISHRGQSATELLRRGMMSSSDFPLVLENVANKTLREAYEQIPQTFRPLVSETNAMDFKPITRVQIGDAPKLLKVNEHGEFTHGAMSEGKESYKLETFGRLLSMTRQMLINDDLGAFTRVATSWGRSASELESEVVWNLIMHNPPMSDGKPVFHADHGNLQLKHATKGKLDLDTLSDARRVMRLKKSLEGKRLNLSAQYLVVSSLYETTAEKLLTPVIPNKNEDVNIFANRFQIIVESLLDDHNDKAWYLVAPPSAIDGIEIAYLDGERGVQLDRQEGFAIDGVQFKARLDFGAAFIDHRGWFKNEGVTP